MKQMFATTSMLLGFVIFVPPPPPTPSPPPPVPSPPPIPPSDVFVSNDALLGCNRANHKSLDESYNYGTDEFKTVYEVTRYNDTGLHNLLIHVDSVTCKGRAKVFIPHAKNGHVYSLYTSTEGTTWNLVSELEYQVDSPPPPSPSPPPPLGVRRLQELSFGNYDDSIHHIYFTEFNVTKEPLYVRSCIDCDGSCNGIDTIDSLVTCNSALPLVSPPSPVTPPDMPPQEDSIPWWVWIFVATTVLLSIIVCMGCMGYYYMNKQSSPPPPPAPAKRNPPRPVISKQVRRP